MPWVDLLLAGVVLLSAIFGVARGFVFELMSLVGWFVAYLAAKWLGPWLAPHLPIAVTGSPLNAVASFIVAFIIALLLWSMGARLVRLLLRATPLGVVDRLAGGLFGGLRGLLFVLLATLLVSLTPWVRSADWRASLLASESESVLCHLRCLLPALISEHLPASAAQSIDHQGNVLCAAS